MLTEKQKVHIIVLHNMGKTNKEIAEELGTSMHTVNKWINKYRNTGTLNNKIPSGRPKKFDENKIKAVVKEYIENNSDTLEEMRKHVSKSIGMEISICSLRKLLHEHKFVYGNYCKKPFLSEEHKRKRLDWALRHAETDWSKIIFSDEMIVFKNKLTHSCWYKQGKQKILRTTNHSIKRCVWACITLNGLIALDVFQHNLCAINYIAMIDDLLLPNYNAQYTYQQDNSPVHTSALTKEYFRVNNIPTLEWPACSPDLNPIENLWEVIKRKLSKINNINSANFDQHIRDTIRNIDYECIFNMIRNMHIRIQKVIDNNGDVIDY